jgi:hypothetical protein
MCQLTVCISWSGNWLMDVVLDGGFRGVVVGSYRLFVIGLGLLEAKDEPGGFDPFDGLDD